LRHLVISSAMFLPSRLHPPPGTTPSAAAPQL
jgi:hypothetical protein